MAESFVQFFTKSFSLWYFSALDGPLSLGLSGASFSEISTLELYLVAPFWSLILKPLFGLATSAWVDVFDVFYKLFNSVIKINSYFKLFHILIFIIPYKNYLLTLKKIFNQK